MRLSNEEIVEVINKNELDVRKTHDARWIDQKCTPDVVCAVADIVDSITQDEDSKLFFNSKDVWFSDYAREYVLEQFNKSDPTSKNSVAEYNKFYQQPLNLLAYSGVLKKEKHGRENVYSVVDKELLQYIGMVDRHALQFLQVYITEVLKQSGIWGQFDKFLNKQTAESFNKLKNYFAEFCHTYTKIKKKLVHKRIFPKILNPLAQKRKKLGAYRGRISKEAITYSSLMYNTENFRDVFAGKPKGISRQEWLKKHPINKSIIKKYEADSAKAKQYVRRFNDKHLNGVSELHDDMAIGLATQMHHIFPQHSYKEISGYVENIIALTPSQHFNEAHPRNNTQLIDEIEQEVLLKAKAETIKYVTEHKEIDQLYSFDNFAHVLKVGFDIDKPETEYNDFVSAVNEITAHYRVE